MVVASGVPSTIPRPWYVLGPAHWWPYMLMPYYMLFGLIPGLRENALRLGLVRLEQMVASLVLAVGKQVEGIEIITLPQIRGSKL